MNFEALVQALSSPTAWPEPTSAVEVRPTHMSMVFLLDTVVYKLKKPVKFGRVDFLRASARRANCFEELRINRELAGPGVYLDVVPVSEDGRVGGSPAAEWLVKMRRLPDAGLLDRVLAAGPAPEALVDVIATTLAHFYASRTPEALADPIARARQSLASDLAVLAEPSLGPDPARARVIGAILHRWLDRAGPLLAARVTDGRFVEGHGDLRPEHICLTPPVILDRLEFDRDLRVVDLADEVAFLGMECERLGDTRVREQVSAAIARVCGDAPPADLSGYYAASRAILRARQAIGHLLDGPIAPPDRTRWRRRATEYLDLAERHAGRLPLDGR
jgi:aminoglycoside phosphotransferase family enzyme